MKFTKKDKIVFTAWLSLAILTTSYIHIENNPQILAKENIIVPQPYELGLFMNKKNATESDIENLIFNGLKYYDLAIIVKMNNGSIMNLGYPLIDGELTDAVKFNMQRTNGYLTDNTAYTDLNVNPGHRLDRELLSNSRSAKMDKIGEYKLFNTALIINHNSNNEQTVGVYFEEKPEREPTDQHPLATIYKSQYDSWVEWKKRIDRR